MPQSSSASVSTLWRYPIKSMMGEELNASVITPSGVLGDRSFALIDKETGKVVSAKNPKKWPDFFAYRAAYASPPGDAALPPVWITLPSGKIIRSDEPDVDAGLSFALSRAVTLASSAPKGPSLEQFWPENEGKADEVSQGSRRGRCAGRDILRLRHAAYSDHRDDRSASFALSSGPVRGEALSAEYRDRHRRRGGICRKRLGWEDHKKSATKVRLRVTDPCPRCVMPTLAQGDLPKDLGILHKGIVHNKVHVPFAASRSRRLAFTPRRSRRGRFAAATRFEIEH